MTEQTVTAWTIARGIILAVVVLAVAGWLFSGGLSSLLPSSGDSSSERQGQDCESQNEWWAENGIDRRIDC